VRVVTRHSPKAARLIVLPTVEVEVANPHDEASLARAFADMDAVINLVGVPASRRAGRASRRSMRSCRARSRARAIRPA
jgi:uncharacterized protein YbjT (DUF2867 family)